MRAVGIDAAQAQQIGRAAAPVPPESLAVVPVPDRLKRARTMRQGFPGQVLVGVGAPSHPAKHPPALLLPARALYRPLLLRMTFKLSYDLQITVELLVVVMSWKVE